MRLATTSSCKRSHEKPIQRAFAEEVARAKAKVTGSRSFPKKQRLRLLPSTSQLPVTKAPVASPTNSMAQALCPGIAPHHRTNKRSGGFGLCLAGGELGREFGIWRRPVAITSPGNTSSWHQTPAGSIDAEIARVQQLRNNHSFAKRLFGGQRRGPSRL
ncbi:MAG: hypothetical protein R3B95_07770 [Nitrospirales bacterium]|nr:hypothetical protein [Nitrospirales bacterium]